MNALKVLVTRPKEQGERLAERLKSKGFIPILAPMIEIAELDPKHRDQQLAALKNLEKADAAVAISSNAFGFAQRLLDSAEISIPNSLEWFAIGEATAEAMRSRGLNPVIPDSRFDTEGLLSRTEMSEIRNKKFVLLAGVGGRKKLEDVLRERGALVERIELYQRVAQSSEKLDLKDEPDALIAMSGETLESLSKYLEHTGQDHWLDRPLFVSSARTAELAFAFGFKIVRVSESASENSLLEALCRFASEV